MPSAASPRLHGDRADRPSDRARAGSLTDGGGPSALGTYSAAAVDISESICCRPCAFRRIVPNRFHAGVVLVLGGIERLAGASVGTRTRPPRQRAPSGSPGLPDADATGPPDVTGAGEATELDGAGVSFVAFVPAVAAREEGGAQSVQEYSSYSSTLECLGVVLVMDAVACRRPDQLARATSWLCGAEDGRLPSRCSMMTSPSPRARPILAPSSPLPRARRARPAPRGRPRASSSDGGHRRLLRNAATSALFHSRVAPRASAPRQPAPDTCGATSASGDRMSPGGTRPRRPAPRARHGRRGTRSRRAGATP